MTTMMVTGSITCSTYVQEQIILYYWYDGRVDFRTRLVSRLVCKRWLNVVSQLPCTLYLNTKGTSRSNNFRDVCSSSKEGEDNIYGDIRDDYSVGTLVRGIKYSTPLNSFEDKGGEDDSTRDVTNHDGRRISLTFSRVKVSLFDYIQVRYNAFIKEVLKNVTDISVDMVTITLQSFLMSDAKLKDGRRVKRVTMDTIDTHDFKVIHTWSDGLQYLCIPFRKEMTKLPSPLNASHLHCVVDFRKYIADEQGLDIDDYDFTDVEEDEAMSVLENLSKIPNIKEITFIQERYDSFTYVPTPWDAFKEYIKGESSRGLSRITLHQYTTIDVLETIVDHIPVLEYLRIGVNHNEETDYGRLGIPSHEGSRSVKFNTNLKELQLIRESEYLSILHFLQYNIIGLQSITKLSIEVNLLDDFSYQYLEEDDLINSLIEYIRHSYTLKCLELIGFISFTPDHLSDTIGKDNPLIVEISKSSSLRRLKWLARNNYQNRWHWEGGYNKLCDIGDSVLYNLSENNSLINTFKLTIPRGPTIPAVPTYQYDHVKTNIMSSTMQMTYIK